MTANSNGAKNGRNGVFGHPAILRGLLSLMTTILGALLYQSYTNTGRINTMEERISRLQVSGSENVHVLEERFDRARDTLIREDERRNKEVARLESRIDEIDRRLRIPQQ